jgi:hypothetical protein
MSHAQHLSCFVSASVAGLLLSAPCALAQATCLNSGTLGSLADGTHSAGVLLDVASPLGDPDDRAAEYQNPVSGGAATRFTRLPFQSALNPASSQPFSVEFWAEPAVDPSVVGGAGPCPLFNRQSAGNRTGWVWFQRSASLGWNFAMYNAFSSTTSVDLTGGTAIPFSSNHLVATWDGTTGRLYHNGVLVDSDTNTYVANSGGVTLSVASYDNGDNGYIGVIDDVAIYATALSASEVSEHYNAGVSTTRGVYTAVVAGDAPLLRWRNRDSSVIGTSYCAPGASNSTGYPASIFATGSPSVAANDVTLTSVLIPDNSFGFYLTSLTQGNVVNPGGSAGILCLSGSIGRYVGAGQILNSGTSGSIALALDLTQHPTPTGLVSVTPGQTWHFQSWFRDVASGVATSNFTDGLRVTFE